MKCYASQLFPGQTAEIGTIGNDGILVNEIILCYEIIIAKRILLMINTRSISWILINGTHTIADNSSLISNCVLINKTVVIIIIDDKSLSNKTIVTAGVRWNNSVVLVDKTISKNEITVT